MSENENRLAEALRERLAMWKECERDNVSSRDTSGKATLRECIEQLGRDLAAHDAARAQAASVGWQPIETAPRDGTIFLGCAVDYYHPQEAVWAAYHPNARGKECWRTSAICGNKIEGLTHWMPLPAAPQPQARENV